MKKLMFILFLFSSAFISYAQIYVEGVPLEKINDKKTILIKVSHPTCMTKAWYKIPEKCKFLGKNYMVITDEKSTPIFFNTVAEVITYFQQNGFEYIDNFSPIIDGDTSIMLLIFSRKENDSVTVNLE